MSHNHRLDYQHYHYCRQTRSCTNSAGTLWEPVAKRGLDIKFCFIINRDSDGGDDGDEDGTDHYPYDAGDVTWRSLLENKAEDGRYETVISSPAFTWR